MKRVVIFGGLAMGRLLRGIRMLPGILITAITPVTDSGNSTGLLRKLGFRGHFSDLTGAVLALAPEQSLTDRVLIRGFQYRFVESAIADQSIVGIVRYGLERAAEQLFLEGVAPEHDLRFAMTEALLRIYNPDSVPEGRHGLISLAGALTRPFVGSLAQHTVRNIFLWGLESEIQAFINPAFSPDVQSLFIMGKIFRNDPHCAIPVSNFVTDLWAKTARDGEIIFGEANIDSLGQRSGYDPALDVVIELGLEPQVEASNEVLRVLEEADTIITSFGDHRTTLGATLLPTGIKETLGAAQNKKQVIMFAPLRRKSGETNFHSVSDLVHEVEELIGGMWCDYLIYDPNMEMPLGKFKHKVHLRRASLSEPDGVHHDPKKVKAVLRKLLK